MAKGKPSSARSRKMTPFALGFGGLFVVIGLILFTAAWLPVWNDYRHGKQFAAEGALSTGMVLTKSRANAGSVTVLGVTQQLTDYFVRYRFTTHSGKTIEGDAKITSDEWGLLEERGFIKVRYLPDDPATNEVSGQVSRRSRTESLIFTLIGVVFTGFGGLTVFIVLKNGKPAR
jgi:Protein of unknown function (DUF3592)